MNPIEKLHSLGQSIWYDNIERRLLENGELAAMIARGEIRGVTSNPSIFNNAIAKSADYDVALVPLAKSGATKEEIYENLAVADIQAACDLFRPLYAETERGDGYVSLEVSPYLAHDTAGTAADAARLWAWVDRPNLMIKIPATKEGLSAITKSIAAGINVNVTLIFSLARYEEVMEAYLAGLEQRLGAGQPVDQIASVASFFISRIDSNVDSRLEALGSERAAALQGKIAVSNAKLAYAMHKQIFAGERWEKLRAEGAQIQRALWASTSTKNKAYPDTKYVDELIGPHTVNTVPPATLVAFTDHGMAAFTLEADLEAARNAMDDLAALGISMEEVTQELEDQG
ncbi:MAG TPA: transaldolase, partial [Chloroflexi bacterium]|nr:transaldolase [Chloroflexota bacterium]